MKYTARFVGRGCNEHGIMYHIVTQTVGDTPEQALRNLYDRYSDVHEPKLIGEDGSIWKFDGFKAVKI